MSHPLIEQVGNAFAFVNEKKTSLKLSIKLTSGGNRSPAMPRNFQVKSEKDTSTSNSTPSSDSASLSGQYIPPSISTSKITARTTRPIPGASLYGVNQASVCLIPDSTSRINRISTFLDRKNCPSLLCARARVAWWSSSHMVHSSRWQTLDTVWLKWES